MKKPFEHRTAGFLVASVVLHSVVVAALVQIVFRYPLGHLVGFRKPNQERVQFVKLPAESPESSRGGRTTPTEESATPAPLPTPTTTPLAVPITHPRDSSQSRAAGGSGTGLGVAGSGLATGVEPRESDRRIALEAGHLPRVPRTAVEAIDGMMSVPIGLYNDSVAVANAKRKPGDWTIKDKHGRRWGWDTLGIRLGEIGIDRRSFEGWLQHTLKLQTYPIERRSREYIRRDVLENAQLFVVQSEFKTAVNRIRERKDRERLAQLPIP